MLGVFRQPVHPTRENLHYISPFSVIGELLMLALPKVVRDTLAIHALYTIDCWLDA